MYLKEDRLIVFAIMIEAILLLQHHLVERQRACLVRAQHILHVGDWFSKMTDAEHQADDAGPGTSRAGKTKHRGRDEARERAGPNTQRVWC